MCILLHVYTAAGQYACNLPYLCGPQPASESVNTNTILRNRLFKPSFILHIFITFLYFVYYRHSVDISHYTSPLSAVLPDPDSAMKPLAGEYRLVAEAPVLYGDTVYRKVRYIDEEGVWGDSYIQPHDSQVMRVFFFCVNRNIQCFSAPKKKTEAIVFLSIHFEIFIFLPRPWRYIRRSVLLIWITRCIYGRR